MTEVCLQTIYDICNNRDIDRLKKIVREIDDININNIDGSSILHWLCRLRYVEGVKYLLEQPNINPNSADIRGFTPIIVCLYYIQGVDVLPELIKDPRVIVTGNFTGSYMTRMCSMLGYEKSIVEMLKRPEIDINKPEEDLIWNTGMTPLMSVRNYSSFESYNTLINDPRIDISYTNEGKSVFYYAAMGGNIKILKDLKEKYDELYFSSIDQRE